MSGLRVPASRPRRRGGPSPRTAAAKERRHVAGEAWIRVLTPGATEAVGLLVDDDVIAARLPKPDGGENAGHPGTDDRDAERRSERPWLAFTTRGKLPEGRTTGARPRVGWGSGART